LFVFSANCNSGQEYNFLTGQCDFCEIGYYRDATDRLQPNCQMCNQQFITSGQGATTVTACSIGKIYNSDSF